MFQTIIDNHIQTIQALNTIKPDIKQAADDMVAAIRQGHKMIICGNGGSAADAQHFAGELVGRFLKERQAWPVLALGANIVAATAIGNDYGFGDGFAREVEGFGRAGDVFVGISTSGNSKNIIQAVKTAKIKGMQTIGLLGNNGGDLRAHVDQAIIVPAFETPRIQEAHMLILHYLAAYIEETLTQAG